MRIIFFSEYCDRIIAKGRGMRASVSMLRPTREQGTDEQAWCYLLLCRHCRDNTELVAVDLRRRVSSRLRQIINDLQLEG